MKQLLLMRHAKSSHDGGMPDHDRPLNDRGERDADAMGKRLAAEGIVPDLIISSTALRARDTAERFALAAGHHGKVVTDRRLYLAPPEEFLEVLSEVAPDFNQVMLVAHNPGSEELLTRLAREERAMPTAAIAQFELDVETWQQAATRPKTRLKNFWLPE